MDRYKKKPLKFMGKGSEVRAAERNAARRSVRQQRFSLQRPLEDADVCQPSSKFNDIPKPNSRLEMLKKWKAEKELKKKMELLSKKPAFKTGSAIPQLDAGRLQESKSGSFSSKLLTPNRSISKVLKASRIQPVSKLADIHKKKPDLETGAKSSVQTKSVPSTKPQIARLQVRKTNSAPTAKPQITKPQVFRDNTSAVSTSKPQINTGIKANTLKMNSATSHIKPPCNNGVKEAKISKPLAGRYTNAKEDKKIPTSGIKPATFLPQRKLPLLNKQEKPKAVSSLQPKKAVKAVKLPLKKDPEEGNSAGSSSDQHSLFQSCQLSVIEPKVPLKEESFAPSDFVFRPSKIRDSWLDEGGPCSVLSRVMKEMKHRTSTPIKEQMKLQESECSFKAEKSTNTGESSKDGIKEYCTIPISVTTHRGSFIDSPASKVPEIGVDKTVFTFSVCENPEDAKPVTTGGSSDVENQECKRSGDTSVNKENLLSPDKENRELVFGRDSPVKKDVESASPGVKNPQLKIMTEEKPLHLLKELTDNVLPIKGSLNQNAATPKDMNNSVFYPPEQTADAPEKSTRRMASNYWKIGKPSLALIRESPECSEDVIQTPKSHRRKGLLVDEFTPRRSLRLARKSELKMTLSEEEDIFNVKECFLDSPSVDAATRMSTLSYDFDKLHLEASAAQGLSNDTQSTSTNSRKVSLLYSPPRVRASTRNKSLKGDLMTFSPNV